MNITINQYSAESYSTLFYSHKIECLLFENHPPAPSLASKKGLVTERFFYLTRPLLLGEVPHPLLKPPRLRRGGLNR